MKCIYVVVRVLCTAMLAIVAQTVSAAGQGPLEPIGAMDCVINPSVVADLGSSTPGILKRVAVDRSDLIKAGDVVAELESEVEQASVNVARVRAESSAVVDLRRVSAAFGRRQEKRSSDLFKRKVLSTSELDERETDAELARLQLRQAKDDQAIAELELVQATEVLKRRAIHSPISGVVMERFKVVGEYIEDQPVARVAQLDPLHVEVIVPIEHLGQVQNNLLAEVWVDEIGSERWTATVSRIDRVADVASGTYGVRLSLPNPEYRIPAGLRCRVEFTGEVAETDSDAIAASTNGLVDAAAE